MYRKCINFIRRGGRWQRALHGTRRFQPHIPYEYCPDSLPQESRTTPLEGRAPSRSGALLASPCAKSKTRPPKSGLSNKYRQKQQAPKRRNLPSEALNVVRAQSERSSRGHNHAATTVNLINHRPPENSAYLFSKAEFLVSRAGPKFHHLPDIYKTEFATLAASK